MKVLITGASGQLGGALQRTAPAHADLNSIDIEDVDFIEVEMLRARLVVEAPEIIMNAAAYNDVGTAEDEEDLAREINADAVAVFVEAMEGTGGKLVHVSCDCVFDGSATRPYLPGEAVNPLLAYQYPEKLIPLFLLNALHGRPLPIYGDGMNARDWLHVEDHCRGIEACLLRGKPGETYNIGGGAELPNIVVIDTICAEVDRAFADVDGLAERYPDAPAAKGEPTASLKTFVADRAGHDRRYAINEAKARAELGYAPRHRFEDGLRQTLRWYLDNENWWRPLLKQ